VKKIYVLDTSAILNDPHILLSLQDNTIVLPEVVLDELDGKKDKKDETGYNSREATRILDNLIEDGRGKGFSLFNGLPTPGGGVIKIELNHMNTELPQTWNHAPNDNRILQVCKGTKEDASTAETPVILITHDRLLKIKAEALNIECQVFEKKQVSKLEDQYKGVVYISVPAHLIPDIYTDDLDVGAGHFGSYVDESTLLKNEFIVFQPVEDPQKVAVAKWDGKQFKFMGHSFYNMSASSISPKNTSQRIMMHALEQPASEVPLVIFKGPAGTAKTLMALAVGLEQTMEFAGYDPKEDKSYRKLLICRPAVTMGEDLGFLPGGEGEKLDPYMRPVQDNLEVILNSKAKTKEKEQLKKTETMKEKVDEYFKTGIISAQSVGFLRGRSISNQYLIIDEAQNATASQIKGIITRAGEGTKIILCGDPEQIDHPYLDERTNGLSVASEMMKGSPLCIQVTLTEKDCVRSKLSKEAVDRFSNIK